MLLKFSFCFLYLIQTGCSANSYVLENHRQTLIGRNPAQNPRSHQHQHQRIPQLGGPINYNNEFYYFRVPENMADDGENTGKRLSSVKKRQQIVFTKNPVNDGFGTLLRNLLQDTMQYETQIFVFTKMSNNDGLKEKFVKIQTHTQHKPEVFFLKYRNGMEVQGIQSAVMDHYTPISSNRFVHSSTASADNTPVRKDYAMKFLPKDIDVVPGSSYIPLS